MTDRTAFLPVSREDLLARGWYWYDFLLVTGDAYVDHPSFGTAIIGRTLEKAGFRVAVLAQPDWHSAEDFRALGKPRLAVLVNAGNLDSMVAHYTAAKKRRHEDLYTPGGVGGKRPDRAVIVYCNRAREAFPDTPVIIGGIEASLRRFAHYDYWDDAVRRSILEDSGADLLSYGMGERSMTELARQLKKGRRPADIRDVRGTCFLTADPAACAFPDPILLPAFETVRDSKLAYAKAAFLQQNENDHVRGRALIQPTGGRYLIQNPPQPPLEGAELDAVYELPYARAWHPDYEAAGGVPALEEVRFSIAYNRGCFGCCSFCALALHQGRYVSARSEGSVLREAAAMTADPLFKGYIHDVGGPTANFSHPACAKQARAGACADRQCLFPTPCPNLDFDERPYLSVLRKLRALPGVKRVFVRSGVRYDYMLQDKACPMLEELAEHHVSGQLRAAPEHVSDGVLRYMGKPHADVYERFCRQFERASRACGREQYVVPYLMSSHPGSGLAEAIELACWLRARKLTPEQVQDFYPTPGTLSTAMYFTGIDPRDGKAVYVARTAEEKQMQRALLQAGNPRNRDLVRRALRLARREDLIGTGPECLVPPAPGDKPSGRPARPAQPGKPQKKKAHGPPKGKTNARPKDGRRKSEK